MAGIDSLLRMLMSNQGDELRVATDAVPKMLAHGSPLRLSMPPTDGETLRLLVEGVLTPEREATLRSAGKVEFPYVTEKGDEFAATFQRRGEALEATFKRGTRAKPAAPTYKTLRVSAPGTEGAKR